MFRLKGKVALVTGATRGIGAAIAQAMVDEGAKVVIGDVLDTEGEAFATRIGAAASYTHLDVTEPAEWASAVEAAVRTFGKLDVLVTTRESRVRLIEHYTTRRGEIAINPPECSTAPGGDSRLEEAGGGRCNIDSAAAMLATTASRLSRIEVGCAWTHQGAALELARDAIRVNSVHRGSLDALAKSVAAGAGFIPLRPHGRPEGRQARRVLRATSLVLDGSE